MAIKSDSKGRQWDTDEVRCDNIEFAIEHPEYTDLKVTADDIEHLRRFRPDSEALKKWQ